MIATDLFFSEYIEGGSSNKALEIFNGTGAPVDLSGYTVELYANGASSPSATYTAPSNTMIANGGVYVLAHSLATSAFTSVAQYTVNGGVVNFNGDDAVALKKISSGSFVDIIGRIGEQVNWTSGSHSTVNKTLVRKSTITSGVTTNPASGTGFATMVDEWISYNQDTSTYLGSHTLGAAPAILENWNDSSANGLVVRVDGLESSTDYYYVVRAVNVYGASVNSNPIAVTTNAVNEGNGANTTIGGASTPVAVAALTGFADNNVEIDPATTTDDDFTVTVTGTTASLVYSISTSNNLALNGVYLLNHDGFLGEPTSVSVNMGSIVDRISDATSTLIEISGIAAKGTLEITLEGNETLPIELSSFTYTINANNLVSLQWITQTETGVSGYYVYRGTTDQLAEANMVSSLIPATNTSTTQTYIFVDADLQDAGVYYYWLQNVDMDGGNNFYGPIAVQYNQGNNENPAIPVTTSLQKIYPNPFNPIAYIGYGLSENTPVQFKIYNNRGQLVRTIDNAPNTAGNHRIEWNGLDNNGSSCSTGLYLVRMEAGRQSFTQKVILVK